MWSVLNTWSIWIARKLLVVEFLLSWKWCVKLSIAVNALTCCIVQVWLWLRVWASGMNYPVAKLNSWHQKVSPWHNFYSFFLFFFLDKEPGRTRNKVMFKEACEKSVGKGFICTFISVHSGDANLSPDWNGRERQLFEGTLIGLFLFPLFSALKKYSFG